MMSKLCHDVKKFVMTSKRSFIMLAKSASWCQNVRHDVKKCVMTSHIRHDVKRCVITSKGLSHDVKTTSWRTIYVMTSKSSSLCQKVRIIPKWFSNIYKWIRNILVFPKWIFYGLHRNTAFNQLMSLIYKYF